MVGPTIAHIHQTRQYSSFINGDKSYQHMKDWLKKNGYKIKDKSDVFCRGRKKGIHVNFVPKFLLKIESKEDGSYVVNFDYYAKLKVGTGVAVGVVTMGWSMVLGLGTYAYFYIEADKFANSFWDYVDTMSMSPATVLEVEKWSRDKEGNYVKH